MVEIKFFLDDVITNDIQISLKGMAAAEEIVHDYSHTPNVDFGVISLAWPNFRGHVDGSTTVCGQHLVR